MKKYNLFLFLFVFILSIGSVFGASLNGSSSIYTFNVSNCMADNYSVGCSPSLIEFSCDVTNKQFIDFIEFQIDGSLYNASILGVTASYDFLKLNQSSSVNETLLFNRIYITDSNGDTAIFNENVSVVHDCVTCTDVGTSDPCSIYDNTTQYHVYAPSGCQSDFNESVSCDYCSQDLVQVLSDCSLNDTQNVSYYDANYFSCCSVTGFGSDCDVLSFPYNSTTSQACSFLEEDFVCNVPSVVELHDKMSFSCSLPVSSSDFVCVVNVLETDFRVLQTNPEYKPVGSSLIGVGSQDFETRQNFVSSNGLLNAYFTDKNLLTEQNFVVEVVCNDGFGEVVSQTLVEPFYEDISFVNNRIVWAKENVDFMIIIVLALVLVILFVAWVFKNFKGGYR